jgi:hypothetical protein
MVFNRLLVTDIIPGAVLGDVVHDQWIEVGVDGESLLLFDQDAICPRRFIGYRAGLKIGLMPLSIRKVNCGEKVDDGSYICKVIERTWVDGVWGYLFDLEGVKVHLCWDEKIEVGSLYQVEGRLDLLDVEGDGKSGWRKE